ncbi:hypothetical protein BT69DRAFT_1196516, partial [Atractiella rhizophila]
SHTGQHIASNLESDMEKIGFRKFALIVSDNTRNVLVAKAELVAKWPCIINCFDPDHHLDNTMKDIAKELKIFDQTIKENTSIVGFFSKSTYAYNSLEQRAKTEGISRLLVRSGTTRWGGNYDTALSMKRGFPPLSYLIETGTIIF